MPYALAILMLAGLFLSTPVHARITKIVVEKREPFAGGNEFSVTGAYEKLVGKAYGEVDPKNPLNKGIVNLDKAPRNAGGNVEYWMEISILKPVDMRRGNGTIFYDTLNRGNKAMRFNAGAARSNDPSTLEHTGDGFMMRQGYAIIWSGWQGDILPGNERMTTGFPVAKNADGSPIRKTITTEFVFQKPATSIPISFDRESRDIRAYPAVEEAMPQAKLYRRAGPHARRALIARSEWSFTRCTDKANPTPSNTDICYPAGFSTDAIYELVYEARDPIVMGLGFAATRDLVSYLRRETSEANPFSYADGRGGRTAPRWAVAFGSSQAGRFLKDLVYQGFNLDENKKIVFDGLIPHISGSRRIFVNAEFSMPGRFPTAVEGHYFPGDEFPFTYETTTDPFTKKTDGLLVRCRQQQACPKIMHWDSGTEAYQGRNSLVVTDAAGKSEMPIPPNVRLYYFSGTQHGPVEKPARDTCQQLSNPLSYQETQRALLAALEDWVAKGIEPPKSRFPRLSDGTLVEIAQVKQSYPAIPGAKYNGKINDLFLQERRAMPPEHIAGTEHRVFVPKLDADGNELAGVRSVELQVPVATHSGWNLRTNGYMEDELCYLVGSYIPFAKTKEERMKSGDPRLSLEERYKDNADYVEKLALAARSLIDERFLLPEDAARILNTARKNGAVALSAQ
ncbi:MAG TPA: alpha/beta hydrolase domain-containing protein [Verrucomicrobiae bacterium]|nr:alpha/beta hydrolase domain-containing protein [Verrucomicrobiae bacterium]